MKYADLHIHSYFSDSTLSFKDIISESLERRISCISVTDHDSMDIYSSPDFLKYSLSPSLEIIKGLEISAVYKDTEIHLLGYLNNGNIDREFLERLKEFQKERRERIFKMVKLLSKAGFRIDAGEFDKFAGSLSLSRLHLAKFLEISGQVKDMREAFSKYIGENNPYYVRRSCYNLRDAVSMLKKYHFLVFLAHPLHLKNQEWIKDFSDLGLDGIEVFYPQHSERIVSHYLGLAGKLNLLVSGGSDSHGSHKKNTYIGRIKLPYKYAESIKNAGHS